LAVGTGVAVVLVLVADKLLGAEFFAVAAGGDRLHIVAVEVDVRAAEDLRGDLEAIEELTGAAGIEPLGAEVLENLGEGELDRGAVFDDRQVERDIAGRATGAGSLVSP